MLVTLRSKRVKNSPQKTITKLCTNCEYTEVTTWFWVQFGVKSISKLLKDNKIAQACRASFVVFEKCTSVYLHQIPYFRNNVVSCQQFTWKTCHRNSRRTKFWQCVHTICNLHLYYNFALVLYEKCLVFSQSDTHNFLIYNYY